MKAIAFSVGEYEEPLLRDANHDQHELTLLPDRLTTDTVSKANGYDAVLIFGKDDASEAVLRLVKEEGAQLLVHLGDFDYQYNPIAWEDQTNRVLGYDFPQIAVVGNHDLPNWAGPEGYAYFVSEQSEPHKCEKIETVKKTSTLILYLAELRPS